MSERKFLYRSEHGVAYEIIGLATGNHHLWKAHYHGFDGGYTTCMLFETQSDVVITWEQAVALRLSGKIEEMYLDPNR